MTVQASSARKAEHLAPPSIDGDFYRIADLLDAKERVVAQRVRDFMEAEVAPIIEAIGRAISLLSKSFRKLLQSASAELVTKVTARRAAACF